MVVEYNVDEALRNAAQRFARWPSRSTANRLEPECWPELHPSFSLPKGARVFTIGSCFARHIEKHLADIGFDIPAITFLDQYAVEFGRVGAEIINKYTPPSIWQELSWTKRILDRDGVVTLDDIEPFLLTLPSGKVFDMHRLQGTKAGISRENALRHRQRLFELFSQAFDCDVCIITLGLVEAWYDTKSDQYIEFNSLFQQGDIRDRLRLHRLGHRECYEYVDRVVALLSANRNLKILITTSPIPLSRTFTTDDVIVANTYSKAVLRSVAGEIAQAWPNVDYFPSFENVMLTKQPYVWEEDLIHVDGTFVGRIMHHVIDSYVSESRQGAVNLADRLLQIGLMVKQKQYARAYASFCEIEHLVLEPSDKDLPLAKMFVGIGDLARAREYVERALLARPGYEMMAGVFAFSCGKIFDDLGDHARAAELRSEFFETARKVPMILQPLLPQLIAADDEVSIKLVQDFAEKEFSHNEDLMLFMARTCVQRSMKAIHDGDISAATEMSAIAFRFAPKDKHVAGVYNALSKGRLPLWILRAANVSTEQIQPAVQNESSSEA